MSTPCNKAKVVLDADRRKAIILADAKDLAFAQGLTLVEDEGLLEEVAGLVEWPVVLMGHSSRRSSTCRPRPSAPPSAPTRNVLSCARRPSAFRHGRVRRPWTREKVQAGSPTSSSSSRTLSRPTAARRSRPATGASWRAPRRRPPFWATDRAALPDAKDKSLKPLDQRLEKLDTVVFHEKLGTQGERIARIEALARSLRQRSAPELAARAARLAKATRDRNGR